MCHRDPLEIKKLRVRIHELEQELEKTTAGYEQVVSDREHEIDQLEQAVADRDCELLRTQNEADRRVERLNRDIIKAKDETHRMQTLLERNMPNVDDQSVAIVTALGMALWDDVNVCNHHDHGPMQVAEVLDLVDNRLVDGIHNVYRAVADGNDSQLDHRTTDLIRDNKLYFP